MQIFRQEFAKRVVPQGLCTCFLREKPTMSCILSKKMRCGIGKDKSRKGQTLLWHYLTNNTKNCAGCAVTEGFRLIIKRIGTAQLTKNYAASVPVVCRLDIGAVSLLARGCRLTDWSLLSWSQDSQRSGKVPFSQGV